jgi:imidazolonepropionase-like amidohydrolase
MKRSVLFSFLFLTFICPLYSAKENLLVLSHVTVIDGTGIAPQPNRIVVIKNDRILNIDEADKISVPAGAEVIDGTGKFLIPGLWDMHVHWFDEDYLPVFIANGVTGVRIMWGEPTHRKWRKKIEKGILIGPRMLIGSELIDGTPPVFEQSASSAVSGEKEAKRIVHAQKGNGADFIKVYSRLTKKEYQSILEESKNENIPVVGHVPYSVSITEASRKGQRSIEHLHGVLLACSNKEEQLRKQMINAKEADWMAAIAQAKKLLVSYDETKANALFSELAKNKTWQCPTLTVLRTVAYLNDPNFRNDKRTRYMPSWTVDYWDPEKDNRFTSRTEEDDENFKKVFAKEMEIVGAMNRAGIRFLAGSDVGNPYCFGGFSLHDELVLLVQAGFSPMQALQAATRNAAEFSGRLDLGTIEKGKLADLVLLDADPLQDIKNTQTISAVIYGGRIFKQQQLQAMLAGVEKLASKPSIAEVMLETIQKRGIAAAVKDYNQLKTTAADRYDFGESGLRALGFQLLRDGYPNSGLAVLKLSAEAHPSSDSYEHLAAAYLSSGNKQASINYYRKAVQLDSKNLNAKEKLKQLQNPD